MTGYNLDENFDSVLVQYNMQVDVNILTDRKIPSGTTISINSENSDTDTLVIMYKDKGGVWIDTSKRIPVGTGSISWTTTIEYFCLKIQTNKAGIHVKANIKANVSGILAEKIDKTDISQELGDAEDKVVSQKCITKELANVSAKDLPQYFKDEALSVSKRIKEKLISNSLVYNIVTDTHERYWVKEDVLAYNNTFKNIKLVNAYAKSEGIINLGDMLSANQSDSGKYDSQDVVNEHLRNFSSRMHDAHDNCLFMLGNHDGLQGSVPTSNGSYSVLGVNSCCERPKTAPYFYVDKPTSQIRCIFLCAPYIQEEKESWSFGKEQITWLIKILSELKESWHVIFFSHTPLFSTDMLSGDYADVAGIINAFCNHGSFTTSYSVSCDFSSLKNTKAVAWVCGHEHYDMVVTDSSYYSKYNLSIPIIIISCNYRYGSSGNVPGASYPARNQKDKTQDLWDTFIYNRGQGKIYMIRFGAGVDREINV